MSKVLFKGNDLKELFNQAQPGDEVVLENKTYELSETLVLDRSIILDGNGAHLIGKNITYGIDVVAKDTTVKNLRISGCVYAVNVDPLGNVQENVLLEGLTIDLIAGAFEFGSSKSNGVLRNVTFKDNVIYAAYNPWIESNELDGCPAFNGGAAHARLGGSGDIDNCLLENCYFIHNTILNPMRVGFNIMVAIPHIAEMFTYKGFFHDNIIKNIVFKNNYVQECWDGAISFIANTLYNEGGVIDGITIDGNTLGHGIAGIYMHANEPMIGSAYSGITRNVVIKNNSITRVIKDVGEPTRGIFIMAGRQDYFPNTNVENGLLENVEIYGNTLNGAGMVICGQYSMFDGVGKAKNNITRNINIHDNKIMNADYAFEFYGAQLEGRRIDWNFGYPRHEKVWGEELKDDHETTYEFENNSLENVVCKNNIVDGYRYRVCAAGAYLRGHGTAKANKCHVEFKDNQFLKGESHVRVENFLHEDFAKDLGQNEVNEELRYNK